MLVQIFPDSESWPMRWSNYASENLEKMLSYTPSPQHRRNRPTAAIQHPVFHRSIEAIQFTNELEVENIVAGVQRTRGISLRYEAKFEGQTEDVVFGNAFTTDGTVYRLSPTMVREIEADGEAFDSAPFDADFVKLLHHHIERLEIFEPRRS